MIKMMVWLMRALVSNTTSSTLWVAAPGMALILDVNLCMLFPEYNSCGN